MMRIHFAIAFMVAVFLLFAVKCTPAQAGEFPLQDSCVMQAGDTFYRDCETAKLVAFVAEAGNPYPEYEWTPDWVEVEWAASGWRPGMPVFSPQPDCGTELTVSPAWPCAGPPINPPTTRVPLPGTLVLVGAGLLLLWRRS